MLILRDIGLRKIRRFNRLLESVPGLTPRVLSMRLKELQEEGFIECLESQEVPRVVRWGLTEKGTRHAPHPRPFRRIWREMARRHRVQRQPPPEARGALQARSVEVLRKYSQAPILR